MIYSDSFESPVGYITIYANETHVTSIRFGKIQQYNPNTITSVCKSDLQLYFSNCEETYNCKLKPFGTKFQNKVLEACQKIPFGETRTYKQIAESIGSPKAYRAVGSALHKNPFPILIPCHRVLSKNGNKLLYGGGSEIKKMLLDHEGIVFF